MDAQTPKIDAEQPSGARDSADGDIIALTQPTDGVPAVVSTPAEFEQVAARLSAGNGPIAVDTERASGFRYSARAYLIQIRRAGSGSFLIDPIDHPDALAPVITVMNGPQWILHAADQDLPCLRELGFVCVDLFDTELAGRLLGIARVNLAAMTAHFLGLGLAKGHGAADWSRRPLPDDWLNYAALDVDKLIELRKAIADALDDAGKSDWAVQEFAHILAKPEPSPRPDRWRRTSSVHTIKTRRGLAIVRELWTQREQVAARRDIAPSRVLPDAAIVNAALTMPSSAADLAALPVFNGPRQRKQASLWFSAIERANTLNERSLPPKSLPHNGLPPVSKWGNRNPEAAERMSAVREAMGMLSEQVSTPVENLLAPDALRQLAWDGITVPEEIESKLNAAGARPWQRELCIPVIAAAVASTIG